MIISRYREVILAAGFAILGIGSAQAQQLNMTIVASCGTTNFYGSSLVGQARPATMDVNGVFCSSISTGGGAGSYTGATATQPGTNGTTATPVQGVDGGKAVAVTWTGQTVGITGTVQLGAGSAAIGSVSVSNFPATQAVSGTVTANQGGAPWSTTISGTPSINNAQVNGVAVATGTGASNTGTQRVAVSSDSTFAITNTSFASTQSGAWNVGLLAGTAVVGKVGIDQTTPGTTNRVSIGTDGTVAATQSGAYTVTQGPAGSTAWKVDGSGVTQPVSAASLPLPSGASTAANQTVVQSAPGTSAGTALTIQGASNGVAIPTTPTNAATVATAANQNSTAAGTSATSAQGVQGVTGGVPVRVVANSGDVPISGQYLSSQVTATNGQILAVQLDRHLHIANTEVGSDDPLVGITPTVSQSATSQVAKGSQGNLYGLNATNLTTTAGFLVTINAATAPASGAAITPIDVVQIGGTVGAPAAISYGAGPPEAFATGIVVLITTSLTTYTPGGNAIIKSMWR